MKVSASRDATLYQEASGAVANGSGEHLFVGRTGQADTLSRRRGVLHFELGGLIPPDATVTEVELTLNMSRTIGGSNTIAMHRLLAEWGQGASNAALEEGVGAPSELNDATWIHTHYDTGLWSAAGGDYDPTVSASRTVIGLGPYTWGSTAELVADVQGWVDDPSTNHGWILIGNEFVAGTAKRFDTREHVTLGVRPSLRVEYIEQVPATSTWGLIVLAFLVLCAGSALMRRCNTAV